MGVSPHVLLKPFGVAITIPAGKLSANATPVSGAAFGLTSVNDSDVVCWRSTDPGVKDLAIVGGSAVKFGVKAPDPTERAVWVVDPQPLHKLFNSELQTAASNATVRKLVASPRGDEAAGNFLGGVSINCSGLHYYPADTFRYEPT